MGLAKNCIVPGCSKIAFARGMCPMHYQRNRKTGSAGTGAPLVRITSIEKRLWSKVEKRAPHECWPWKTSSLVRGYGYMRGEPGEGSVLAHRVAFELTFGGIPEGMDICHHCDNPLCCNPSHLFVGSRADNMADAKSKGRTTTGEKHGNAKLTTAEVIAIRASRGTQRETAPLFDICQQTVSDIKRRKRWGHVA